MRRGVAERLRSHAAADPRAAREAAQQITEGVLPLSAIGEFVRQMVSQARARAPTPQRA